MRDVLSDSPFNAAWVKGEAAAVARNRLPQYAESLALAAQLELEGRPPAGQPRAREPLAGSTARKVGGLIAYQSGGVAVLPLSGFIFPRPNILTYYGYGTAASQFAAAHQELLGDASVSAVVWDVDSPGGSVAGVPEAAEKLLGLRGKKKTVAVSNTLMASAAYWLASAADEIVATPSSMTGSIGVYVVHDDYSAANAKAGIKPTYVYAGQYKIDGNPDQPLSPSALASMQAMVDDYYTQFLGAVARGRRTTRNEVRNGFGQGDALTADRAVAAKLADRVATLDAVVTQLGRSTGSGSGPGRATSPALRDARQRQAEATIG